MAVQDYYTDPLISGVETLKLMPSVRSGSGVPTLDFYQCFTVLAADNNGSVYRVFKDMDPDFVPLEIWIANSANTAGTNYGLGLYNPQKGAVINATCLAATLDMSAAAASFVPGTAKNGLNAISPYAYTPLKRLWELAGVTDVRKRPISYDIAFTATTVGTAGGNIAIRMRGFIL